MVSTVTASVSMGGTTTDANGIATGTFTSGHRTETTTLIVDIDGDQETTEGEPTAAITQVWNELGSEAWTYEEYFEYDEASPLTYAMLFDGDVPITTHAMEFETLSIGGLEWDPDAGEDWDEDGFPDGDYIEISYSIDDVDTTKFDLWSALVEHSATTETPAGTYGTNQTISFDWDFVADYVEFQIVDTHTYDATGQ